MKKQNKIYLVHPGQYDDNRVIGAFNTHKKAVAFIDKVRSIEGPRSEVNNGMYIFDIDNESIQGRKESFLYNVELKKDYKLDVMFNCDQDFIIKGEMNNIEYFNVFCDHEIIYFNVLADNYNSAYEKAKKCLAKIKEKHNVKWKL